jgi:UDP-N-acetylglucosamine 4,6-dehydratase
MLTNLFMFSANPLASPADKRDLNYDKYFVEGNEQLQQVEDYNSHNTERLNIEQIKEKLLKLDYIKEELKNWEGR